MKNEDLEKRVIKRYQKEYYQTIARMGSRIQNKLNNFVFKRDDNDNRNRLTDLIRDVMLGYRKHNFIENWDGQLVSSERNYIGMISIHFKGYSTFSSHHYWIDRNKKRFGWSR